MKTLPAGVALATLWMVPALASAQKPPGRAQVAVEIPKGGLPPGPATAEEIADPNESQTLSMRLPEWPIERIRFEMPDGPIRLEFSRSILGLGNDLRIEARSDSGQVWKGVGEPLTRPAASEAKLFVGTADDLATLSRAAHAALPDEAGDLLNGFKLLAVDQDVGSTCRDLGVRSTVVFAEASTSMAAALRQCAARGIAVLAVGAEGLGSPHLGPGRGVFWGEGRYAWALHLDHLAVDALRDLVRPVNEAPLESIYDRNSPIGKLGRPLLARGGQLSLVSIDSPDERPRELSVIDRAGILWLLAAYVLALALVGAWGVRHPRRSTLLWLAFPATAALAAAGLAAVGWVIDRDPSNARIDLLDLVAPDGEGVESVTLEAHARAAETLTVAIPWTEGSLDRFRLQRGIGSPFTATPARASFLEDRIAGKLTLEQLQIARRSEATVHLTRSINGAAPYLTSGVGGLSVVNPTPRTLLHVALILDGKRATLAGIAAGATVPIRLGDTSAGDPWASWLTSVNAWHPEEKLPPGAYLLAADDDPGPMATLTPSMPTRAHRLTLTIGPIEAPDGEKRVSP